MISLQSQKFDFRLCFFIASCVVQLIEHLRMLWHLRPCQFGLSDCPQEAQVATFIACLSSLFAHAFLLCTLHPCICLGLLLFLGQLSPCVDSVYIMAAHVRADRDVLSALEWLGQTDPGQVSAVSRELTAQMRSSLISSIGASFAAEEPGPSTAPPDQPWLTSGALHSSTPEGGNASSMDEPKRDDPWNPPQTGDTLHSEQTQMLRGHPVRKVEIIACREPCQHCTLAMCGFQTENPLDSHFAGQGKHTCKRCYRSIRDRSIGAAETQPQQQDASASWQGESSWQGDGSWWGGSWGSSRW